MYSKYRYLNIEIFQIKYKILIFIFIKIQNISIFMLQIEKGLFLGFWKYEDR